MYPYIRIHPYISIYPSTYTSIHFHSYTYVSIYPHPHIHVCIHISTYTHMCPHIYHISINTHIYPHIYPHIHQHTHNIYIYTHTHRDYKRIEAASRYKFSQARGSNWSLLMGGKSKSRMQSQDVRSCIYWLLNDRLFTTRHDEKTRKGEGEKNKMLRKKFSRSKFLKQKLRQKMVKISTDLT